LLSACVSAEKKVELTEQRNALEAKNSAMAIAFEKSCIPYLSEIPVKDIVNSMLEDGYQNNGKVKKKSLEIIE